jgi:hypothetical protein
LATHHGLAIVTIILAFLGLVKEFILKRPSVKLALNAVLLCAVVIVEHVYLLGFALPGWGILLKS